jgi:malate/lactate dehydrogenase
MRRAAYEIIRRKGATNHAIWLVTVDLLQSMLRSERRILTVSRVQDGALGMRDVALSLPAIVSAAGASRVVEPQLSAEERSSLDLSAKVLREAAAALVALLRPAPEVATGNAAPSLSRRRQLPGRLARKPGQCNFRTAVG